MGKKLWGGRFAKGTDPLVEEFTKSIQYDKKLAKYDVLGSLVHIRVLKKAKLLSGGEFFKLDQGLKFLLKKVQAGMDIPEKEEDIHTFIQNELSKSAGPAASKLHTARSRNDQVVFSVKLYCKDMLAETGVEIIKLEKAFLSLAAKYKDVVIPGFTHLQHAQPVYLADYLGAYVEMLKRDNQRLQDIKETIVMTMGSGALAGTPVSAEQYSVKIDIPELRDIGVEKITAPANSLDTVSGRDFVIEILSALAMLGMHLSRLSEDLVLWASQEFDFVELDDAYCTGSSLMPQKKNPDVLELARGNAGRFYGNLVSVLTMMKGLPLSYNRDMQLDKEPLFDSFELASLELRVFEGLIKTLSFNKEMINRHLADEGLYATDLVYYLVKNGVAFKEAHTIVGNLVKYSLEHDMLIRSLPEKTLKQFSDKLVKKQIIKLFDPKVSVQGKRSIKRRG